MIDLEVIRRSAFVEHGPAPFRLVTEGPLADTTFAVKDLFDVAGVTTACGNRDRLRDDGPAVATAPSVLAPLMAGALLVGKTHTDEVACGMFGENDDFGTPINPAAPDRVPGGSSSGSAVAVAAGLCDFALGTDTGGSIRVPASFCGIVGLRTTYGRITTAGVMAMAPSFDSVGLLARDGETLRRVAETYFGPIPPAARRPRLRLAADAFAIPTPAVRHALAPAARRIADGETSLYREGVRTWLDTFRPLQLQDLVATLGRWASAPGRRVTASIRQRMDYAASTAPAAVAAAIPRREALARRLAEDLGDDTVLVVPTTHDLPPRRGAGLEALIAFREHTLALTCVASLARLPQLTLPAGTVDGVPVGLSFIAGPGRDELLAGAAATIATEIATELGA